MHHAELLRDFANCCGVRHRTQAWDQHQKGKIPGRGDWRDSNQVCQRVTLHETCTELLPELDTNGDNHVSGNALWTSLFT